MNKKAFSLIELMIVIVIIGVIYSLVVAKITLPAEKKLSPSLKTLKAYVASFIGEGNKATLVCTDSCKKCMVTRDGVKIMDIEPFFNPDIMLYRYDFFMGDIPLQQKNCFEFSMDRNGVSDQVIVVTEDKVYDYVPYFSSVEVYDSLEDLHDAREKLISEVQ